MNTNIRAHRLCVCLVACAFVSASVHGSEARDESAAESAKPIAVPGGQQFRVAKTYDQVFERAVTYLQTAGYTIETASKDAGSIFTVIEVAGGWHQTGTRVQVTVIRESDTVTLIRVAVSEQKRFKAIQTEPWDDPVINSKKTAALAAAMITALGAN